MAGHGQRLGRQISNGKGLVGLEQVVKLAAIGVEFGLQVEDGLEYGLHIGNRRANGDLAAQVFAQVVGRRQVVGMGVGFENPLHGQRPLFDEGHQGV